MTNNTTAALTDEQRSRVEYALDYMGGSGFAPEADILRALLTSPRAAVRDFSKEELTVIANLLIGSGHPALLKKVIQVANSDAAPAAPVAAGAPDQSTELARITRMFMAACTDLGLINEALGLDPDDGGAEPILDAIQKLKDERDQWADAGYAAQAVAADGAPANDAVTREQVEAWARQAGIHQFTEQGLERLGDFAILARAAVSPATADTPWKTPKQHCQNGGDVCLAGNRDGVCCPEDSCDIDDGTRKNPATADEREAFERWMVEDEKCIVGSTDPYPAGIERQNWKVWRAAWARASQAAAPALKTLSVMQDEIAGVIQQHMDDNAGVVAINTCALSIARHVMQQATAPADAISLLRKAHRTLACAALTQIRDGEAVWAEIGRFLDAAPAEAREPDAYVPIHPRNGPLWASTVTSLDADRPKSYPVKPVYLGVPADAGEAVAWICSGSNDFSPIVRDRAAALKLSQAHGDGKIVALGIVPDVVSQGAQGGKGGEA